MASPTDAPKNEPAPGAANDAAIERAADLRLEGRSVAGTVTIDVPPWSKGDVRVAALERALGAPLHALAAQLKVTIAAAPSRFAFARSGPTSRDATGKLVYDVRGRVEGETLVPSRPTRP